jgi:hypothetical protein
LNLFKITLSNLKNNSILFIAGVFNKIINAFSKNRVITLNYYVLAEKPK